MNNLYKLLAFLCLVFVTSSINAQTRPAYVSPDGLITLDPSSSDVAPEYVADISKLQITSQQDAKFYFQKYIDRTSLRGIQYIFDFVNQKLYIKIDMANQILIPLSYAQQVSVNNFNDLFRMIYLGQI